MSTSSGPQPGRTEYPYAHSYMRKLDDYCVENAEAVSRRLSHFVKKSASTYAPNVERWSNVVSDTSAIPEMFYWEATVVADVDLSVPNCFRIDFADPFLSVSARGQVGVTFGGGLHRNVKFLTRNGKMEPATRNDLSSWYKEELRHYFGRLQVVFNGPCNYAGSGSENYGNFSHATCNHDHNIHDVIVPNFGQRPFLFDIDGYIDRIHRLTRTLPLEIIDEVARWVFSRPILGIWDYRAVYPFTLVSRRWLDLCRQVSFAASSITSHAELKAALHLGSLARSDVMTSTENVRKPWLRSFLASSSPRHLKQVTHWTCDFGSNFETIDFGPPAEITFCIRSNSLANISRLDMYNRRFKKWSQLAHIVFSLPQLEDLGAYSLSWDDSTSIEVPPSWLRFSRRLRALHHNSCSPHITTGFLWLFITGKCYRKGSSGPAMDTRDVASLARIIKLILNVIVDCDRVVYVNDEDTACCVTTFASNGAQILQLSLEVKRKAGNFLNLVNITINGCVEFSLFQVTEIQRFSRRLSNYGAFATSVPLQLDHTRDANHVISYTRHPKGVFGLSGNTRLCIESHPGRLGMVQGHAAHHSFSEIYLGALDYLPGIVVPQKTYPTPSGFTPSPPVQFYHQGHPGVNLGKIYDETRAGRDVHNSQGVVVRPLSVLQTGSTTVLNILWPGHGTVWCSALPEVPQNGSIVGIIAWAVRCMYRDMTSNGVTALARDPEWEDWALCKCPFEILYLIELRHVSPAGWQPVFCVGDMKE